MSIYRNIYEKHFGSIPKDDSGRSYEIHHIDGNHSNNCIENLKCLSIQEHYDIHYSQGDLWACWSIGKRMNLDPKIISELSSNLQKERVRNGTHHLLDRKKAKETFELRMKRGDHPFSKENNPSIKRIKNGTHQFLDSAKQRELSIKSNADRINNGTHNFKLKWICPHCNKTGENQTNYIRWHGDNCKKKKGG